MRNGMVLATALILAACGEEAAAPGGIREPDGTSGVRTTALGPTPAGGPAATPTEIREFRDWRAVCDNGNACMAWTGSNAGGWLRVSVEAGPEAVPVIEADGWAFGDGEPVRRLSLRVDGRDHRLDAPRAKASPSVSGSRAWQLGAALARARRLELAVGPETVELPASGAAAALLWIDERQGRLGTTTALMRRGDRPASTVPAAPPLPVVRPAPAMAQTGFEGAANPMEDEPRELQVPAAMEALEEVKACRAENNEHLDKAVLAGRLDATTVLWGIPCGSGAYNATYLLYLASPDGRGVRPAGLPVRPGGSPDEDLWLVNPAYDPAAQTLTVFPRGRGLGDCGTIQTWTWTTSGFALTEERTMGDCWGMSPDVWPTTWRTR